MKTVMDEPGSELVDALWNDASQSTTAVVAYAEARAALARARRDRRLSSGRHYRSRAELDDRWDEIDSISVDDALARAAGELAEQFDLRGVDAVHLGAALGVARPDLVVATWDRRLGEAARGSGLNVAP